mgnify:CR=1 FL=1
MKQIDFDHGTVTGNILGAALPMLVAQILMPLYNIVDVFILPGFCPWEQQRLEQWDCAFQSL